MIKHEDGHIVLKPGARVSIVEPLECKVVLRAHALSTGLAGYQLAQVEDQKLKLVLMYEGITWARGWSTKAAEALRVAVAL